MSRKNGHVSSQPSSRQEKTNGLLLPGSAISPQLGTRTVTVELAEDEVRLLINVIQATPVQGNLQSLPAMIARLKGLQEKLGASLNPHPSPLPGGEGT